jgi:hypothetical protein
LLHQWSRRRGRWSDLLERGYVRQRVLFLDRYRLKRRGWRELLLAPAPSAFRLLDVSPEIGFLFRGDARHGRRWSGHLRSGKWRHRGWRLLGSPELPALLFLFNRGWGRFLGRLLFGDLLLRYLLLLDLGSRLGDAELLGEPVQLGLVALRAVVGRFLLPYALAAELLPALYAGQLRLVPRMIFTVHYSPVVRLIRL